MKALKISLVVLSVLVVAFFSFGFFAPSYEYDASVVVNASPEKCWAVFHDTKRMSEWTKGFESLTLKSGEALQPGSTYEIIINDEDHKYIMQEKLTEITAPTKVAYLLVNDVMNADYAYTFVGSSTTTVTVKFKVIGNNLLWRSILFLSKSYMKRSAQEQLDALKAVIEKS